MFSRLMTAAPWLGGCAQSLPARRRLAGVRLGCCIALASLHVTFSIACPVLSCCCSLSPQRAGPSPRCRASGAPLVHLDKQTFLK